jgi:hypothetical protein
VQANKKSEYKESAELRYHNQSMQMLPEIEIKFISQLCNAVIGHFFLLQWKQIIMIQKSGKIAEFAGSYRSISLLSVLPKLFEKLLLLRFFTIIEKHKLIPNHQFACNHRTDIQNCQKSIVINNDVKNDIKAGRYCIVVFLDISGFRQNLA